MEDSRDDGVEGQAEDQKQDPCTDPEGVEMMQDASANLFAR